MLQEGTRAHYFSLSSNLQLLFATSPQMFHIKSGFSNFLSYNPFFFFFLEQYFNWGSVSNVPPSQMLSLPAEDVKLCFCTQHIYSFQL